MKGLTLGVHPAEAGKVSRLSPSKLGENTIGEPSHCCARVRISAKQNQGLVRGVSSTPAAPGLVARLASVGSNPANDSRRMNVSVASPDKARFWPGMLSCAQQSRSPNPQRFLVCHTSPIAVSTARGHKAKGPGGRRRRKTKVPSPVPDSPHDPLQSASGNAAKKEICPRIPGRGARCTSLGWPRCWGTARRSRCSGPLLERER